MFDSLSTRLNDSLRRIRGKGRLTEDNIKETLRDIRMGLLEADVALPVVKQFVNDVRERAVGAEVSSSLSPGQVFIKIVSEELTRVMGEANESLNLKAEPPAVVLLAGLQGAGKTTSCAKLARHLKEREKKKVMVVSADVYRPAAIKQLETLAGQVDVTFFPSSIEQRPVDIVQAAIAEAKLKYYDVLLVDTAGRLAIDTDMMQEIQALHAAVDPVETLFVVDSMTGQDAANTAKAFHDALPLTGVILTKTDGDARGGAALSIRYITGKPIKFLGVGEKTDALEPFHPDRVAGRILDKGDVLSLIEDIEEKVDQGKAEKLAKKMQKGKSFDLNDLRDQFEQMLNMGGMTGLLTKLPGMGSALKQVQEQMDDQVIRRQIAVINSMTPKERRFPDTINSSRKKRIAKGSGQQPQDVNRLLKQHKQMGRMMKKMTPAKMAAMMKGMGGGGMPGGGMGGLPPGMMPPR